MSNNSNQAKKFYDACETGKGWEGCVSYCHADATFSGQCGALAEVDTLKGTVNG